MQCMLCTHELDSRFSVTQCPRLLAAALQRRAGASAERGSGPKKGSRKKKLGTGQLKSAGYSQKQVADRAAASAQASSAGIRLVGGPRWERRS